MKRPQNDLVTRIAWTLHKHYCTLPGVCSTPDEVDRAAARAVLALMGVKAEKAALNDPWDKYRPELESWLRSKHG